MTFASYIRREHIVRMRGLFATFCDSLASVFLMIVKQREKQQTAMESFRSKRHHQDLQSEVKNKI